jgi:sporulation protein YlmC with PRC-barrel domain
MRRGTTKIASATVPGSAGNLFVLLAIITILAGFLISTHSTPVLSQGVALLKVDVSILAKGYRASKLVGSGIVNDKSESIGKLDDMIIDQKQVLFAVIQVGGFLGIGSKLVAVPYQSLKIDEAGRRIELPGASREELKNLDEFKYQT